MERIRNNTAAQLASLIRPDWEGYAAAQSFGLDSFVRIKSPWERIPRPPLFSVTSHYDLLKKTLGLYEEYIQSIDDPRVFAGAWSDLTSLMLGMVAAITGGLYSVMSDKDSSSFNESVISEADAAILEVLYPHINSLGRLYNATDSFYKNSSMLDRWEGIFFRGQKHFMGNILTYVLQINFMLKHNMLGYKELSEIITDMDGLFNPFRHMARAYRTDQVGGWLTFSIDDSKAPPIGYWTNPKLRRVADEIIYHAGASSNNGPNEVQIGWHGERGAVTFRNGGHALNAFAGGMPAREFVTRLYGKENIEFIEGRDETGEYAIEEIRVSAYTTSLAAAAAAMAVIPVK